jgi:hypothetical protein
MQHHFVRPPEDVVLMSFQEPFISCPSSTGNEANASLPGDDEVHSDGRIVQRVVPHLAPAGIQSSDCGTHVTQQGPSLFVKAQGLVIVRSPVNSVQLELGSYTLSREV